MSGFQPGSRIPRAAFNILEPIILKLCELCKLPLELGRNKRARFHLSKCAIKRAYLLTLAREDELEAENKRRLARLNALSLRFVPRIERTKEKV